MKILVVDDSTTMRRIIISSLKLAGFPDVVEAGDGEEALKAMKGISLVLTDWNMPVMNGLELAQRLREDSANDGIPIIMITSEGAKGEVMEALASGVNDYIVKPFTRDTLAEKVRLIARTHEVRP